MPLMHNDDVTGVILAGGRSRRMGMDKATLPVAGEALFRRTLSMLQGLFARVLIAGDRPDLAQPGVPAVSDVYPGSALGGLHGGLCAAASPWIFAAPCDLACPDPQLARAILAERGDCDCVVLKTPSGLEPVFALYHRNCLAPMEQMLVRGRYRIHDLFSQVRVRYLAAATLPAGWERALINLNTPEDIRRLTGEDA